jgi:hypothetical protein
MSATKKHILFNHPNLGSQDSDPANQGSDFYVHHRAWGAFGALGR